MRRERRTSHAPEIVSEVSGRRSVRSSPGAAQSLRHLGQVLLAGAENTIQHDKQFAHRVGFAGVVDHLTVAAGFHEVKRPQLGQMLRERGLAEHHLVGDGADRHFTVDQIAHNQQPLFVAHEHQKFGSRFGVCD